MRQKYLKDNLLFDCRCQLCNSDPLSKPELLRTAFMCKCRNLHSGMNYVFVLVFFKYFFS